VKNIVVYTKNYCSYCKKAAALLKARGVAFIEIDITYDENKYNELVNKTAWDTVPQVFADDDFIGGYDDLAALDRQGRLFDKLGLE
jgi:glutaredoxin 3